MPEASPVGESHASLPNTGLDPSLSTSPLQTPKLCAQCNKIPEDSLANPLRQCLRCHSISYCGKECQKAHFKTHKRVCASLAQEYSKTHEPKMAIRAPSKAGGKEGRAIQKWEVSFLMRWECVRSMGLIVPSMILEDLLWKKILVYTAKGNSNHF